MANSSDNLFVSRTVVFPTNNQNQLIVKLSSIYSTFAYAINLREIGLFLPVETPTGQNWGSISGTNTFSAGYRTVYRVAAITAPGTTVIAHGLPDIGDYALTHIWGTLFNNDAGAPLFVPIPQAAPDDVEITVDGVDINIIATTATYDTFSAIVVLEYLKAT